jgi:hypothetical protein
MNKNVQKIISALLSIVLCSGFTAVASASEIEGTLSANSGTTQDAGSDADAVTSADTSSSRASRSGHRSSLAAAPSNDTSSADNTAIILNDGSLASASGLNGTGGGFDQNLENFLAGNASAGESGLSPEDAVAFNNSQNPFLTNTDLAATGNSSRMSAAKVWTAVILGLALLGLSGYAVNAFVGYRRENDL